jgi:hypothetical protein
MNWKKIDLYGEKYYGKHLMTTAERCNENLLNLDTIGEFLINSCYAPTVDFCLK